MTSWTNLSRPYIVIVAGSNGGGLEGVLKMRKVTADVMPTTALNE